MKRDMGRRGAGAKAGHETDELEVSRAGDVSEEDSFFYSAKPIAIAPGSVPSHRGAPAPS